MGSGWETPWQRAVAWVTALGPTIIGPLTPSRAPLLKTKLPASADQSQPCIMSSTGPGPGRHCALCEQPQHHLHFACWASQPPDGADGGDASEAEVRAKPEEADQLVPNSGTDSIDSSQGDAGIAGKGETGLLNR